ncbi:hypothetical protein, partial [uncultured Duncaniella sp.]|uniref:hypothetical protein n=1 Tax=uncultured Duncaniella sp. TaxID=2768039 RepID=UPI002649B970
ITSCLFFGVHLSRKKSGIYFGCDCSCHTFIGFMVTEKIAATGVSVEFDGLMKDENIALICRYLFFHRCFIISFSNEKKRIGR